MRIPDDEGLLHFFFHPNDYEVRPGLGVRVRSSKFNTRGHTLSFNRESIWSISRHRELAGPRGWGICSVTAAELRGVYVPENDPGGRNGPIDILSDPIEAPHVDPLLQFPNPSHASVNRILTKGEASRLAEFASQRIHLEPRSG